MKISQVIFKLRIFQFSFLGKDEAQKTKYTVQLNWFKSSENL